MSNLVYAWESPALARFYEDLASFSRLILFDKRGTGLSDHTGGFPTLETRMEDLRAVLDAVGSKAAVVFGSQEGCNMASLFAATYPERTHALVLFQPTVVADRDGEMPQEDLSRDLADCGNVGGRKHFSTSCSRRVHRHAPTTPTIAAGLRTTCA